MKVIWADYREICFDNRDKITYNHKRECCEQNFADFEYINDDPLIKRGYDFDEPLIFEAIPMYGFKFGNKGAMVSVPCYSIQNGYYTNEIDIYLNDCLVLTTEAEISKDYEKLEGR